MDHEQIIRDVYPSLKLKSSILFEVAQDLVLPTFSTSIPTAAVIFAEEGSDKNIHFLFNPDFWNSLTKVEKTFVFIHEVLHVLLRHGSRGTEFMQSLEEAQRNQKLLNVAMDIVINEIILEQYLPDYPLSLMPVLQNIACTVNTVFKEKAAAIERGKAFFYYYMKLLEDPELSQSLGGSMDEHIFLEVDAETMEAIEKAVSAIQEAISGASPGDAGDDQIEDGGSTPGKGFNDQDTSPETQKKVVRETPKEKLDHYLNVTLASKFGGKQPRPKITANWYTMNRRSYLPLMGTGMNLPVYQEEIKKVGKHHLVIYCDVSGSVDRYSNIFMNLIMGLPDSKYEVDVFAWANYVKAVDMKGDTPIYTSPGYGTNILQVLSHYKNNYKKDEADAVIVLTDGEYTNITRKEEAEYQKWVFFMTAGGYLYNKPECAEAINLKL
ncbi:MAG: VWA domain-containing protein [Anaerolineaceae bacterium]